MAGNRCKGCVRELFLQFSNELDVQIEPDVGGCMIAALSKTNALPVSFRRICVELGHSLGRYDLAGQIQGLESVHEQCRRKLDSLMQNRESRLRSYQTLAICAGTALAILLF